MVVGRSSDGDKDDEAEKIDDDSLRSLHYQATSPVEVVSLMTR